MMRSTPSATMEMRMRVLVVGTLPGGIRRAEELLVEAGHEVVRCHEPGDMSFPCAGLIEERGCPLEQAPVDVVVTARDRSWPRPSPFEDGATCGLRRHAPLVVLGTALHPFEQWATRGVDNDADLVEACEEAAAAPLPRHSEIATEAARGVLTRVAGEPTDSAAIVRHQRGRLIVELDLAAHPEEVEGNVVANVIAALRSFDPHAAGIDVSIARS
jgi:hypothetical protein